jgi:hypothetical protein
MLSARLGSKNLQNLNISYLSLKCIQAPSFIQTAFINRPTSFTLIDQLVHFIHISCNRYMEWKHGWINAEYEILWF